MTTRTTIPAAASAAACAPALGLTAPAAMAAPEQAQDRGLTSVFHGIPGMAVDVYADGDELSHPGLVRPVGGLSRDAGAIAVTNVLSGHRAAGRRDWRRANV
ncbi:hypothetical protein [Streptomyces beihaiensis]|uniref:Uncharacterized protein n=1 Tax=Streptomyces beihaiensis TaxID=2984495 RepID=A0ABT3U2F1_9ACTN|nr:hypothetical protein [Streptomyces beihaiensis]MCX3063483.1 hypothetical protein [Streptomyces beihaiensis]